MLIIPIKSIPNQSLTISLDGNQYEIAIHETNGVMALDIVRGGTSIIEGARAVAPSLIIPAMYQEAGNFMFLTSNYQLPYYTKFNISQSLLYLSASDLATYRETPPDFVFSPIADYPLRYKPQGYVKA